ncbi:hypothetical protein ACETRX_22730 [Labrys portucalensis]|uniref:Uncharacterized protein n=1 Tax=Labrys neptuniae TaxID=376174 RepID=A0ABV6ZK17_9HYPH|nr:hypothetical protein [Labrys sp. WJW]OCC05235.1 hypothetical protein BA190_10045 [Labrys sp. WJW]
MAKVTYFVVLPFVEGMRGRLVPGQPRPARDRDHAVKLAAGLNGVVGAIAFSRTGDADLGEFADAEIIAEFGRIPAAGAQAYAA